MGYFPIMYDSRVVIFKQKMFIRLATDVLNPHQLEPHISYLFALKYIRLLSKQYQQTGTLLYCWKSANVLQKQSSHFQSSKIGCHSCVVPSVPTKLKSMARIQSFYQFIQLKQILFCEKIENKQIEDLGITFNIPSSLLFAYF